MKVTFNIPKDAAEKLAKLAEAGDEVLRELGILSLQMEGGQVWLTWKDGKILILIVFRLYQ